MADDREKISNGPNDRPLNETIAGTGPGIPDEALSPGEEIPDGRPRMKKRGYASGLGRPWKRLIPFHSMVNEPSRLRSLEWAGGSETLSQSRSADSAGSERRTA